MDWPCNLNDWRLYYRDNALAAIIPSIQQPPAHQPHQTNPPIVGNRLQRHRGTHVYVLAGGLALAGFILGFTNWALDVPPKLFRTQSRVKRGGTETRHGASLHTWRGGASVPIVYCARERLTLFPLRVGNTSVECSSISRRNCLSLTILRSTSFANIISDIAG